MKAKYIYGLLLVTGLGLTACNDDDLNVTVNETPVIQQLTTGEAQVSAYSAEITGSVNGLQQTASNFFKVGAVVSESSDPTENGTMYQGTYSNGNITAMVEGLEPNKTYYYATYVSLKGTVNYYGEVKSFLTTAAVVGKPATGNVTGSKASVSASVSGLEGLPIEAIGGVKIIDGKKTRSDEDAKKGLEYVGSIEGNTINVTVGGLLPNTSYEYVPYVQIGEGKVYGETANFTTGDYAPQYVDLGLSVLWATANLGADSPEEAGSRVGYGSLDPLFVSKELSDYESGDIFNNKNKDIVANLGWGRLPKSDDIRELLLSTTQEETQVNGVSGVKFTAANGNSIFLPYTGSRFGGSVSAEGTEGNYALGQAVLDSEGNSTDYARGFNIVAGSAGLSAQGRNVAVSVRPVKKVVKEFDPELLVNTWAIDIDSKKMSYRFNGPVYYIGTDDCWESIANEDPIAGDSWSWDADWADWICEAVNYGSMTFNEDGTYSVVDLFRGTTQSGTYTINTSDKTVTINGADVLCVSGDYTMNGTFRILDLTSETLRLGVVRSDGQLCSINYILGEIASYYDTKPSVDNSKTIQGDIEGNGNYRIEIYNMYGAGTANDSPIALDKILFNDMMALKFHVEGVSDNLKEGATGVYHAVVIYADYNWGHSNWDDTLYSDALVTGDGDYVAWIPNVEGGTAEGAVVFTLDIKGLAADLNDVDAANVTITQIDLDEYSSIQNITPDANSGQFQNKDGNEVDGRIEIYNEYGAGPELGVDYSWFKQGAGTQSVVFTISGIDDNLKSDAAGEYSTQLSYAAASWYPSYWGEYEATAITVKGDGTYAVQAPIGDLAEGAVVWTIELYGLWQDLVDPSAVTATIDAIYAPAP